MLGGSGGTAGTSTILGWTQLAANVAAALTFLFAAYQFHATTKVQGIQNSLSLLNDGRQLQQQYQAGKADARDIVTFYYRLFVSKDVLQDRIVRPLDRSLCSAMVDDPRVRNYWDEVTKTQEKNYFVPDFVERMSNIRSGKTACE